MLFLFLIFSRFLYFFFCSISQFLLLLSFTFYVLAQQEMLREADITLVYNVKPNVMQRLARCTEVCKP